MMSYLKKEIPNSMFSTSNLIGAQTAYEVTADDIQAERERMAKEQFEREIREYKSLVFGQEGLKRPKFVSVDPETADVGERLATLEEYAIRMERYTRSLEEGLEALIRQNVTHLRGVAAQNQQVAGQVVNVAGMANKAWDFVNILTEVFAERQLLLHDELAKTDRALVQLSGVGVEAEATISVLDVHAAADSREELNNDFLRARQRLVERAQEEATAQGGRPKTGAEGASDMTAAYVREHGAEISARVTDPPVAKKKRYPNWRRRKN